MIYGVIVIYNSALNESVAYKNLAAVISDEFKLIIVDNSTIRNDNGQCCCSENCKYIAMGQNAGLSKAFNVGIDFILTQEARENDAILFLNDDTAITEDFVRLLQEELITNKSVDIFVPFMQGQDGVLYSPAKAGFLKNHYVKSIYEDIPQTRFFAIASGTAARREIFETYRFTEDLFLDLIDNQFCDDQRRLGRRFKPIRTIIQQNYAMKNPKLTATQVKRRYRIWLTDFWTYCKKKPIRVLGYYPDIFLRGLMLSAKTRKPLLCIWVIIYGTKVVFGDYEGISEKSQE